MKIDWKSQNFPAPQDEFMGDLRSLFEHALNELIQSAKRDQLPASVLGRADRFVAQTTVHTILTELRDAGRLHEPNDLPSRSSYAKVWNGEASDRSVRDLLNAVGVDEQQAIALSSQYKQLFRKAMAARTLPEPELIAGTATLLQSVKAHRLNWDAAPPGSPAYRDPMNSLPDVEPDLLTAAYLLTIGPEPIEGLALSEEDIAYCLFSACKHGKLWQEWSVLCTDNRSATAAMVDLMGWRNWVRPSLRAAWCLSRMNGALIAKALAFVQDKYRDSPDGTRELAEAVAGSRLLSHVEELVADNYWGDETKEAQIFLEEVKAKPPLRGARDMFG